MRLLVIFVVGGAIVIMALRGWGTLSILLGTVFQWMLP